MTTRRKTLLRVGLATAVVAVIAVAWLLVRALLDPDRDRYTWTFEISDGVNRVREVPVDVRRDPNDLIEEVADGLRKMLAEPVSPGEGRQQIGAVSAYLEYALPPKDESPWAGIQRLLGGAPRASMREITLPRYVLMLDPNDQYTYASETEIQKNPPERSGWGSVDSSTAEDIARFFVWYAIETHRAAERAGWPRSPYPAKPANPPPGRSDIPNWSAVGPPGQEGLWPDANAPGGRLWGETDPNAVGATVDANAHSSP